MRVRHRIVATVVVAFGAAFVVGLGAAAKRGETDGTSVSVDLKATRQVIQGFGSTERLWNDPHLGKAAGTDVPVAVQAQILTALYGRLGLTRVRNYLDQGIETAKGAPFNLSGKLTDAQVTWVKQAQRYGLKTFFPAPVYLEDWMQPDDPGGYVDYAMTILRRWKQDGVEPPLYSPLNEPAISNDFSPQWMHDVVLHLGQRLRAAGFRTKLVIPDDENPVDAYRRAAAVLQDPAARQYVAAIAFHIYRESDTANVQRLRALATQYKLPLWMTEYSNTGYVDWNSSLDWAVRMHALLADGGVNAIDYLWAYFGSWVQSDTMISIQFDNGTYRSFSYMPTYWITGQYSRFVRPGYLRVGANPADGNVLVSAYRGPKRAVVIAVNPTGSAQTLRVAVTGGKLRGVVRPVRSTASEHWASLSPITQRNGRFATTLPPQSVTTFVATR